MKQNLHEAAGHSGKGHLSTFFSPHTSQVSNSELRGLEDEEDELVEETDELDAGSAVTGEVARLGKGAIA